MHAVFITVLELADFGGGKTRIFGARHKIPVVATECPNAFANDYLAASANMPLTLQAQRGLPNRAPLQPRHQIQNVARVVKIFKCAEGSRYSMMDVEDEHNRMRAAFGLRGRIG